MKNKRLKNGFKAELFSKGFSAYVDMQNFKDCDNWDDYIFYLKKYHDNDKLRIDRTYNIVKVTMLFHIVEHHFITVMDFIYKDCKDRDKIIKFNDNLKRRLKKRGVGEKDINELFEKVEIINSYILQYVAGYTFGELVNLFEIISLDTNLLKNLINLKDHRNYIIHCPSSAHEDLDIHLKEAKKLIDVIFLDCDKIMDEYVNER